MILLKIRGDLSDITIKDEFGEFHSLKFIRGGLVITDKVYDASLGWSKLWNIIGINELGTHFSQLDHTKQEKQVQEWNLDNSFTKLAKFLETKYNANNCIDNAS